MNKYEKIILSIKNNWKAIVFATVYVICFFITMGLSFEIIDNVKGREFDLYSLLLICITLLSLLSLIAKQVLYLVFKEEAINVANKSSVVLIPVGILMAIYISFSILSYIGPISIKSHSELENFILLFALPAYIFLVIAMGLLFLLVSFIAFALLRLVIKNTKLVIIIFFVSGTLWFVSLGNISLPVNISVGNINNPQETFQDILSMNLTGSFQTRNTFFIHNDKIYAYVFGKSNYNDYADEFFVVDLQGKNKDVISNSDKMRLSQFLYIDHNEAYYYTMYTNTINTINLETGNISTILELEDNFFSIEYEEAKQKLYEIKPEFQNPLNEEYEIEDDYYLESYFPRSISVKNFKTNISTTYDKVIHWNIEGTTLYLLRGERNNRELYDYSTIKKIHVDKIILE